MINVVRGRLRGGSAWVVLLGVAAVSLSACSSGSHSPSAGSGSSSRSTTVSTVPAGGAGGVVAGRTGITVTGAFGAKPTLTFPAGGPPKQLVAQTVIAGGGARVVSGDTVVINYVGEIWPANGAQPKVFDSSYSRGAPDGFVIGTGAVIPGFDKTLVGQRLGTRLLLSIPPADGYGPSGNSEAGISGTDTLVFVVDLLGDYKPDASAPGVADDQMPAAGWPKIASIPGQEPKITSVAGVKAPSSPVSKLLVKGSGAKIDPSKTLVLQLVQTDIATGQQTRSSWGKQPQLLNAQSVLSVVTALNGQNIGTRAVALLPATPAQPASAASPAIPAAPAEILIVDVVGQY